MAIKITQEDYDNDFDDKKKPGALKYALEIRKFEIELYWKRAAYFWTFIGASFAGYAAVGASSLTPKSDLTVPIACLGLVFSFGWFCVNKGSKQWQENWENHVDLLENQSIGPLYKIVLMRDKPKGIKDNIVAFMTGPKALSVSRINQIISLFVTILWVFLLFEALPGTYFTFFGDHAIWRYAAEISLAISTCIAFVTLGKTSLGQHSPIALKRETKIKQDKDDHMPK